MTKTQVEYWKDFKQSPENKRTLLLFYSGNFVRTFERDASFLSARFGFNIRKFKEYRMVGFPKDAESKYLSQLRDSGYGYQLVEVREEGLHVVYSSQGDRPLAFDERDLRFVPVVEEKGKDTDFKNFLKDFQVLAGKYLE